MAKEKNVFINAGSAHIKKFLSAAKEVQSSGETAMAYAVTLAVKYGTCTWLDDLKNANIPIVTAMLADTVEAFNSSAVKVLLGEGSDAFKQVKATVNNENASVPIIRFNKDTGKFFVTDSAASKLARKLMVAAYDDDDNFRVALSGISKLANDRSNNRSDAIFDEWKTIAGFRDRIVKALATNAKYDDNGAEAIRVGSVLNDLIVDPKSPYKITREDLVNKINAARSEKDLPVIDLKDENKANAPKPDDKPEVKADQSVPPARKRAERQRMNVPAANIEGNQAAA